MLRTVFDGLHGTGAGASVKFANFFSVYDQHFLPIRDRIKSVLEVGIEGGGSLTLWERYFPNIEKVVGIDTHHSCAKWGRGKIHTYIGDASDRAFVEAVCMEEGDFDVVIDDGSHQQEQALATFRIMWPHLNDNGWYIIEDTQCSYWQRLQGGVGATASMVELGKSLADSVTWWAIEGRDKPNLTEAYNGEVRGVHFHPAAIFVEKGPERNHHLHYAFSDPEAQSDWEKGHPNVYKV